MTRSCARGIVLGLLLAAVTAAQAAKTSGEATRELRDLRGRIEQLQKQLAAAEESQAEAADALKESERAISDAKRALRELAQQAQTVNHRLSELGSDAHAARTRLAAQQSLLARLLYQQYVGSKADPLQLMLSGRDPNHIARELYYLGYVTRARSNLIKDIQGALTGIRELAQAAEEQAKELAAITAAQAAEGARLESEKRARAAVLSRISRDIQRQRREISTLRRDEARLTRLVQQLSRIVARPKPAPPRIRNERLPARSAASACGALVIRKLPVAGFAAPDQTTNCGV